MNGNSVLPSNLVQLRDTARRLYADDNLSNAWIDAVYSAICDRWATASEHEAEVLADIMAHTPTSAWMDKYLLPAQHGHVSNAAVLMRWFDAVAAAVAEGVAREAGLTTRA